MVLISDSVLLDRVQDKWFCAILLAISSVVVLPLLFHPQGKGSPILSFPMSTGAVAPK